MQETNQIESPVITTEMSANINEVLSALSLAQSEMESAKKDADNPFFKSKYADYSAVWDAVKGPLTKNGLSYILLPSGGPMVFNFTAILGHKSGQFIKTTIQVKPVDPKIQSYGSLVTYVKRYMLTSITGVALDDDDDGNAPSQNIPKTSQQVRQTIPQNPQGNPQPKPQAREVKNFAPNATQRPPDWLRDTQNRILGENS